MSVTSSKIGKTYVLGSTLLSVVIILTILIVLISSSWNAIHTVGFDLFTTKWNPPTGEYGILSMLFGTIAVTIVALVLALPIGIMTAVFVSEVLPKKYRFAVKSLLELLAGIPSIIYGLIGVAFFSIWIQDFFDLTSGRTLLTGGVLLAIMILPTIITLVDDALNQIPVKYREVSKGLGLYNNEIVLQTLLPIAKKDIIGATLLALGRAIGETMAVMLVVGSLDKIPSPIYNWLTPGQTITSKLGREIAESSFGSTHFSAMIFMGLTLLVLVILLTLFAQRKYKSAPRLDE